MLEGKKNLVYSAPTSAGKTLVAELIMLKRVLTTNKKAIFILPYVSVSREKVTSLQNIFGGARLRVGGFMGGVNPSGGLASVDVAVCTIEKANNMVNRLIEDERLSDLGLVVVDELHLISDSHRGYLLELLLTKILLHEHMENSRGHTSSSPSQCRSDKNHHIQIIGISATLSSLSVLADWLQAAVYTTDFRPIPLTEMVYSKDTVYRVMPGDGTNHELLEPVNSADVGLLTTAFEGALQVDADDGVSELCLDTLISGHAALVFCPTKQWCEELAESMAQKISSLAGPFLLSRGDLPCETENAPGLILSKHLNEAGLAECLRQLGSGPTGLDASLSRCVRFGVAFHHAGLTMEERDILEAAFRRGYLRLLIATSTLSSGVNLPARRVIIPTVHFHGQTLDYLTYKQMVGRAGRKGVDVRGESVLICKPRDLGKVKQLLSSGMPPVTSCLLTRSADPEASLRRALLEVIANGIVDNVEDAKHYLDNTLLSACLRASRCRRSPSPSPRLRSRRRSSGCGYADIAGGLPRLLSACLEALASSKLITMEACDDAPDLLRPTALGRAVLSSSLGPVDGLTVYAELSKARRSVALDTDLHLVYLVTPVYLNVDRPMDWFLYLDIYHNLSQEERHVADLVGVDERFITRCLSGSTTGRTNTSTAASLHLLHRRFYMALILYSLVCEGGLAGVSERFAVNRGVLQSLMQQASTYAGMVTVFCNRLGWTHMERLFAGFQTRLFFGVANELLDLIRLTPLLNVQRARALYLAGFTSVAVLARARTKEVERVLQRVNPYSSGTQHEDDRKTQSAIVLSDGSVISEHDLPPLVVARAQELLREDLCANYGVDLAAVSDRVVGTTSSPSPTSTPPSKRRRCSLADALIQRSPRASGCPASRFSPNALKHKISSPVKLSNLLRLNNAPNVTAATLANPSTPTDSNPQEMASLASIDKDGRSVNVIASSSCCEESCLATQSPVPLSLNVEVEESASDSGRTSTTSNFLRHLDNVASLTPSRVQGSSPVLAGKIHASTPSSIQNEAAVLNDTMTFSMMERITENLPQLLSSSVSKIIENSQNSISARVSTHREPMVYENVSSEDIFSSQIHVDNSTGEAR
uniref:POLAc domain-containing protein n=1 Tax=Mesocestoides corti TaxID=53468 RepID=A0A5K3F6N0_MESCO